MEYRTAPLNHSSLVDNQEPAYPSLTEAANHIDNNNNNYSGDWNPTSLYEAAAAAHYPNFNGTAGPYLDNNEGNSASLVVIRQYLREPGGSFNSNEVHPNHDDTMIQVNGLEEDDGMLWL